MDTSTEVGSVTDAQVEALEPAAHYDYFLKQGVRPDGRFPEECRPLGVTVRPFRTEGTVGSAMANVGSTRVLCSASLLVGTPDLAAPNEGDLG